jgi:hypothetical protein
MEIERTKYFLICTLRRCCYSDQIKEDEIGQHPERKGEMINAYKISVYMEGKGGRGVLTNIISNYDYATCPACPLSLFITVSMSNEDCKLG